MAFARRVVAAHFNRRGVTGVGYFVEGHVFRNIHHHRAWAAAARNMERLFHRLGEMFGVFHQKIVLDDGSGDANGVAFLKRIQPNGVRGHLARDDDHWNAVHVGGGNTGNGIRYAWARRDQRHADIARGTGIAVSRVHSSLLVAHQHVLNAVLLVKRVVNVQHCAAGVAPDIFDVFSLQ